jgi:hypothetical protein
MWFNLFIKVIIQENDRLERGSLRQVAD